MQKKSRKRSQREASIEKKESKFNARPNSEEQRESFPKKKFNSYPRAEIDLSSQLTGFLEKKYSASKLQAMAGDTSAKINSLLNEQKEEKNIELPDRGYARAIAKSVKQAPYLDPWQAEAFQILLDGDDLIVDAPTSAGKTRIIEALIENKLSQGLKLVYTSPVKSLSNDKYREFSEKYGKELVGINTGDFKENLSAPLILATLETYRNSLLGVEPRMERLIIVYDEYHYLQDEGRGSAWEESIILTPKHSQIIMLSASVPNTQDFSSWLQNIRGKNCKIITVQERPVPLMDLVFTRYGWIFASSLKLTPAEMRELKSMQLSFLRTPRRQRFQLDFFQEMLKPIRDAINTQLTPIVIYAGKRAEVERIAVQLGKALKQTFPAAEKERLENRITTLQGWEYLEKDLQSLISTTGIAFHHSGLIPPGRVAIETLLKEGFLRVCTGTMGISLGVNFATRSAVVSDFSRPSEEGVVNYSSSEILQMLGRAGRRGRDKYGFSLWLDIARYAMQKPTERQPCKSSLKFDPTTVLGLLGQHENLAYLSEFYKKSFFMRSKNTDSVLVWDHDLLSGIIYKSTEIAEFICDNIPLNYADYQVKVRKKKTSLATCTSCQAIKDCHRLSARVSNSILAKIVVHLQKIRALDDYKPTKFGQIARYFPQSGGLIIAHWIATEQLNAGNFREYIQAMASFCSAHFKEIPDPYLNNNFIGELNIPQLIERFYPADLFPEFYDEDNYRGKTNGEIQFREFNPGAGSVVNQWLDLNTTWESLVAMHEGKKFSAGDCMMVLFRFSTYLQSCARLDEYYPEIAAQAAELRKILLREPLNARNKMLLDAVNVEEEVVEEAEDLGEDTE